MTRSMRALLIVEVVVAVGIVAIGSAADWTASDYMLALLMVCAVALFATVASMGRSGAASTGGAMTDPIGRGSVGGSPRPLTGVEMVVDDDPSARLDLPTEPSVVRQPFPLVPVVIAAESGIAAVVAWLMFE